MILLKLSEDEGALLVELLESEISDLRMEIADTDRREYRDMLKRREDMMKKLQGELVQAIQPG